jgi:hypothetical protein
MELKGEYIADKVVTDPDDTDEDIDTPSENEIS